VTALASAAGADTVEAGRQPSSLARLACVTWRQHRATLIGLAVFLAVLAGYEVLFGLWVHGATGDPAGNCVLARESILCQAAGFSVLAMVFSGWVVPIVIGMFLGAPLLAREYATGTSRFAWTQSTGRVRQTLVKLILLGLVVLAAAAVLGWLTQWANEPAPGQETQVINGWIPILFNSTLVTEAFSALLCCAVGVLAGVLTRRALPAMVATATAAIAAPQLVYGRLYYWMLGIGALRTTYPGLGASQLTARAANLYEPGGRLDLHKAVARTAYGSGPVVRWLDQGWYADAHGHPLRGAALLQVIHQPWRLAQWHDTFWVSYQPGSRYWLFQSVQGGAELLLALLLGALAIWLVQRRIA
jgi:hypothetical protein